MRLINWSICLIRPDFVWPEKVLLIFDNLWHDDHNLTPVDSSPVNCGENKLYLALCSLRHFSDRAFPLEPYASSIGLAAFTSLSSCSLTCMTHSSHKYLNSYCISYTWAWAPEVPLGRVRSVGLWAERPQIWAHAMPSYSLGLEDQKRWSSPTFFETSLSYNNLH